MKESKFTMLMKLAVGSAVTFILVLAAFGVGVGVGMGQDSALAAPVDSTQAFERPVQVGATPSATGQP